ncbi:MAG: tetratricopeptide repeat protein [bacterium]|nr:tetratricopeptide repeat protein [bacterium]
MKTLLSFGFIVFGISLSFAQPNNLVSANIYLQEKQLEEAKEKIDAASEHPKTADQAKTWQLRGKTYMAIHSDMTSTGKDYGISKSEALLEASASFRKALGLNTDRIDVSRLRSEYQITGNYMLNEGVVLYNDKKYNDAVTLFKGTVAVQEYFDIVDSLALFNVAMANEKAGNNDEAIKYYTKCATIGYNSSASYQSVVSLLRKEGKTDEAMKMVEEGLNNNPEDVNLLIAKINLLLSKEDFKGALFTIDQAIVEMPDNPDLHFSRGTLLESSDIQEAMASYERAIEADPEHINALYNLGAAYYNQAVELRNAEGATNRTGVEELKMSRKYLQRVQELSPGNKAVENSLSVIKDILED